MFWEYKVVAITEYDPTDRLNILGHDGWELVAVEKNIFYLKRQI